jgi:hypothetical protein
LELAAAPVLTISSRVAEEPKLYGVEISVLKRHGRSNGRNFRCGALELFIPYSYFWELGSALHAAPSTSLDRETV